MTVPAEAEALAPTFTHDGLQVVLQPADAPTLRNSAVGLAVLIGSLAVGIGGMVASESVTLGLGVALSLLAATAPALGVLALHAAPTHLVLTPTALVLERGLLGRRVRRRAFGLGSVVAAVPGRGTVPQLPEETQPGLVITLRGGAELFIPCGGPSDALEWLANEIETAAAAVGAGAPAPELQSLRAAASTERAAAARVARARGATEQVRR